MRYISQGMPLIVFLAPSFSNLYSRGLAAVPPAPPMAASFSSTSLRCSGGMFFMAASSWGFISSRRARARLRSSSVISE